MRRDKAIYRLTLIKNAWHFPEKEYDEALKMAIETLEESERKKGKWICDEGPYECYRCSSCGKDWLEWWADVGDSDWMSKKLKYCPNCGADMSGEEKRENAKKD